MKLSPERLKSISRNIRQARESMGYTQEKLAELAGISTAYYCQIELGNKSPSLETLINIADAMHVSIDSLIYGSNDETIRSDIARLFESCTQDEVAKLRKVLYTVAEEFVFTRS